MLGWGGPMWTHGGGEDQEAAGWRGGGVVYGGKGRVCVCVGRHKGSGFVANRKKRFRAQWEARASWSLAL